MAYVRLKSRTNAVLIWLAQVPNSFFSPLPPPFTAGREAGEDGKFRPVIKLRLRGLSEIALRLR